MLKTRFTTLFGVKHPIMLAGMNFVTEPKLVSAVANAGGLGMLATAHCTPDETRKQIKEIRALTDKPFGITQTLKYPMAKENIEVAMEEKVPIINYSLGKPWFIEKVHGYGGKIIGTTALVKHAVKAEQLGVDAVVVTVYGAAGHGSEISPTVLIPLVASQVKLPLIAAGTSYNGRGLAAALVLGAEAISIGTRFMLSKESILHDKFKQLCLKASEQDTLFSDVFDGMPGRVLRTKASERLLKGGFPLATAVKGAMNVKRMQKLSMVDLAKASWRMSRGDEESQSLFEQARFAAQAVRSNKAIREGNVEQGVLFLGQDCGGIKEILTCQEIIERTVAEAEAILKSARERIQG